MLPILQVIRGWSPLFLSCLRHSIPSPKHCVVVLPIANLDPPKIIEESIELCGDSACMVAHSKSFQVLPRLTLLMQFFELGLGVGVEPSV